MSLKESLIHQTEQAVDSLRKRRASLEAELEVIAVEEREARDMLQFLKVGKPPVQNKDRHTEDSVLQVIESLSETFDNREFAYALGISKTTATSWGKRMVDAGVLSYEYKSSVRDTKPTVYRKLT
jgi:response regulator of citrate/malate metabolism